MAYRTVGLVALARTDDDHSAASDEQDTASRKGNGAGAASGGQLALLGVGHFARGDVEVLLGHTRGGRGVARVTRIEGDIKGIDFLESRRNTGLLESIGARSETVDVHVAVGVGDDLSVFVLDAVGVDVGYGAVSVFDRELSARQDGTGRGDLLEHEAVGLNLRVGRLGADFLVLIRIRGEGAVGLVADLAGLEVDRRDLGLVLDADLLAGVALQVIPLELDGKAAVSVVGDLVVLDPDGVVVVVAVVDLDAALIELEARLGDVGHGEGGVGGVGREAGNGGVDAEGRGVAHGVGVGQLARGGAVGGDDRLVRRGHRLGLGGDVVEGGGRVHAVLDGGRGVDEHGLVDLGGAARGGHGDQVQARVEALGDLAARGLGLVGGGAGGDDGGDGVGDGAAVLAGDLGGGVVRIGQAGHLGGVSEVVAGVDVGVEDLVELDGVTVVDARNGDWGVVDIGAACLRERHGRRKCETGNQNRGYGRAGNVPRFIHVVLLPGPKPPPLNA